VTSSASLEYLLARVGVIEDRVRAMVDARRTDDPQPDDPFRGLYLSEDAVRRLLDRSPSGEPTEIRDENLAKAESAADEAEQAGELIRLRHLATTFGLTALDVDLLLVALACELDGRFEQLFGYLNDDVTRRRPSAAVALALCGQPRASATGRARLTHGPLVTGGLISLEDGDRPFPGRALRIPDRVLAHLLGDDSPDAALSGVLVTIPNVPWGQYEPLSAALESHTTMVYLREPATGSARVVAARALTAVGWPSVVIDLERLASDNEPAHLARIAGREAKLRGGGLIAGPVEAITGRAELIDALMCEPAPVLLVGAVDWDPAWSSHHPLLVDVAASTVGERSELWRAALAATATDVDPGIVTMQFRLRPEQVARAAGSAIVQARLSDDGRVSVRHVQEGARAENGAALQRLARRVEPAVTWDDLVLPPATKTALKEIVSRALHREKVLGEWKMRPGGGRGIGVAALFAGDSGTGKTMSAEVVAGALGLDLYVVDLATVVDKYVGETEKNLEKIFAAATGVNGVLLFDEADAIFGKRSEVKDAHDRYANVESAYLLQRMESFDGLAILSTNLRANIDEAFTRRLDVLIDFPLPDVEHRRQLWDRCLGTIAPRDDDLDLDFVARSFDFAGGAIRSASITAAYLAAEDDSTITMTHLVTAVQREYRKLGRLVLESEFGPYYPMLGASPR